MYDKKGCQAAAANGCVFMNNNECVKIDHPCNKYGKKKLCLKGANKDKIMCKYQKSKTSFSCVHDPDFDCDKMKKKKDCMTWKNFCIYGKKVGKDRPAEVKTKCFSTENPAYKAWVAAGKPKAKKNKKPKKGDAGSTGGTTTAKPKKCNKEKSQKKCESNTNGCTWVMDADGGWKCQ